MIERRVELQSPPTSCFRHMTSDSGEMVRQLSVTKTVNSQRRRLKIRRLKYTCQTKTQITIAEGESESESLNKGERESNNSNCTTPEITAHEGLSEISGVSFSDHSSKNEVGLTPRFTRIRYGSVSVIGRRREMEDTVRVELGFASKGGEKYDFFGVYDGHGGARVAEACRDRMHEVLLEEIVAGKEGEIDWDRVMDGCFVRMDEEVVSDKMMGSTAVVAVVGKEVVVVAHCGDSRVVISRGGDAVALSNDHKPDRPDELDRIEADGGRVINWNGYRVLGVLATSRSIGDQYLKPYVISKPEVKVSKRTSADEFLILASDGLWDIISNEVACQVVKRCLSGGRMRRKSGDVTKEGRAAEAAAVLAELAMARGGRDNISVIVVELKEQRDFSC